MLKYPRAGNLYITVSTYLELWCQNTSGNHLHGVGISRSLQFYMLRHMTNFCLSISCSISFIPCSSTTFCSSLFLICFLQNLYSFFLFHYFHYTDETNLRRPGGTLEGSKRVSIGPFFTVQLWWTSHTFTTAVTLPSSFPGRRNLPVNLALPNKILSQNGMEYKDVSVFSHNFELYCSMLTKKHAKYVKMQCLGTFICTYTEGISWFCRHHIQEKIPNFFLSFYPWCLYNTLSLCRDHEHDMWMCGKNNNHVLHLCIWLIGEGKLSATTPDAINMQSIIKSIDCTVHTTLTLDIYWTLLM